MLIGKLKTVAALLAASMLASVLMFSSLAGPVRSDQDPGVAKVRAAPPGATSGARPDDKRPEVTVATARRSRWERMSYNPATVHAVDSVDVYAKVSGYLQKLQVDIGSRVKRGDLLAEIFDPEARADFERSRAELERAEARVAKAEATIQVARAGADLEQAKVQFASRSPERGQQALARAAEAEARARIQLATAELAEARSEVRVAQSALDKSQAILKYTRVESPYDGIVTRRNYHVGALVRSPSLGNVDPIVTIVSSDVVRVVVQVPEHDVPHLDLGDRATVRIDALRDRGVYQGVISLTAYALDPRYRTLRAEIDLPNADGRIRPGYSGHVAITLETRENVMRIPKTAILGFVTDGRAVSLRVVDGRAVRTPIKLGEDDPERIEVVEGLKDGDVVIDNPDARMTDGQAVTIRRNEDLAPAKK